MLSQKDVSAILGFALASARVAVPNAKEAKRIRNKSVVSQICTNSRWLGESFSAVSVSAP